MPKMSESAWFSPSKASWRIERVAVYFIPRLAIKQITSLFMYLISLQLHYTAVES